MPRRARSESQDDLVKKITGLLTEVDRTGTVPEEVKERPGEFLRELYEAWYENGGKAGGKPRNSIRRMRSEWLLKDKHVRSLHPKLTGQVKFDRHDGQTLIELFLSRWEYVGSRRKDDAVTVDGYVPFASHDLGRLIMTLLDAIYGETGNDGGTTILLPKTETEDAKAPTPVQDSEKDYPAFIREADALITISSRRTILGKTPAKGMRDWWESLKDLSQDDQTKDNLFIWVVDIGSRQAEDEGAFAEYLNAGSLALHFSTLARFSSELDQDDKPDHPDVGSMGRRLSLPDDRKRFSRWQWFNDHAAVVIRARSDTSIEAIYREEDAPLDSLRVKGLGLSAEHILPRTVPSNWASRLEKFFGHYVSDLADASLAAACKKETSLETHDILYLAAKEQNTGVDKDDALDLDIVELPSPGHHYDDAYRLIYLASRYRLSRNKELRDEKLAIAYLRQIGFEVLKVVDFMKFFGNVESNDCQPY